MAIDSVYATSCKICKLVNKIAGIGNSGTIKSVSVIWQLFIVNINSSIVVFAFVSASLR